MKTARVESPPVMIKAGALVGGKYQLHASIGEGGMGAVWKAEHTGLGRTVAIKFIRQEQNAPEMVARFLREARAAASIRHRNVVDILDFGALDDGLPFIVMEFLEGQNLKERLASPLWLPTNELMDIMSGALTGLEAVHRAGIVHRDLKPDNIFLARDPEAGMVPKLVDFGISRSTAASAVAASTEQVTKTGALVGTPHYMSPEQARGLKDVDARTDVYSMGVILYEGLTGRLPFDSDTLGGLLIAIATSEFPPVHKTRSDVPAPLAAVVHTAMARNRDQRYGSVRDFRQALLAAFGMAPAHGTGSLPATPQPPQTVADRPAARAEALLETSATLVAAPAAGKGLRAWHLATAAGILVLVGAGVAMLVGGGETAAGTASPTGLPATAAPLPPPDVTVRLRDLPPDAVVTVDGERATGPDLRLPRDGRPHAIEVAAAGRTPWRGTHVAAGDAEYVVSMGATATPATSAPETARPRRRAGGRKTGGTGPGGGGLMDDPGF